MIRKNGDFMDSLGIFFVNPRSANPYVARAAGEQRGFRGYFLTHGEFFLFDKNFLYLIRIISTANRLETFLNRPKKSLKSPISPFHPPPGFARQQSATPAPVMAPPTFFFRIGTKTMAAINNPKPITIADVVDAVLLDRYTSPRQLHPPPAAPVMSIAGFLLPPIG
jgi:hypothetical protein